LSSGDAGHFPSNYVEGEQSPDISKEGHLSDEADDDGKPYFQDDYEL